MSTSMPELLSATAVSVEVTEDTLSVELSDGRTIAAPIAWFPRLNHATAAERGHWRLVGQGHGVHWIDLDEDVSVEGLLLGRPSAESQDSLRRWLEQRKTRSSRPRRKS
jgi:Protein of unknown function (DUF2442)